MKEYIKTVKVKEIPEDISQSEVLITFLSSNKNILEKKSKHIIYFGMFAGKNQSTETDFKLAEFEQKL
ncbi:hypothetical protein ACN4EE_09080 [Geminocystis sp. CENA526]|uniref:hypothetical protein n=1 Tax=Geminocystis sp. CENA526 TaxID=1355871 RepID=UPI003D6F63BB